MFILVDNISSYCYEVGEFAFFALNLVFYVINYSLSGSYCMLTIIDCVYYIDVHMHPSCVMFTIPSNLAPSIDRKVDLTSVTNTEIVKTHRRIQQFSDRTGCQKVATYTEVVGQNWRTQRLWVRSGIFMGCRTRTTQKGSDVHRYCQK